MFAIVQDGVVVMTVVQGSPFTYNDVQYPANWLYLASAEDKAAIGMVDVVIEPMPNPQLYAYSQNQPVYNASKNIVEITCTQIPKDLVECQTNMISNINNQAYQLLLPSDWMVVKAVETASTVPAAWNTWRQTIRTQALDATNLVNACTSVDQLAMLPSIQWAPSPV